MRPGRRTRVQLRSAALGLVAVGALAATAPGTTMANPVVGSAGTDTSLPATDSQVTVHGRGPYADLQITVNQTRDLVNQAISVRWAGGTPTLTTPRRFSGHYLQIMQCWGDDDGTHPENPGPPPEQCVQGATDGVYGGRNGDIFPGGGFALERIISRDDFATYDPAVGVRDPRTGFVWMPFRAVDGTTVDVHYDPAFNPTLVGGSYWLNPYFNSITTNEIAGGRTGPNGTGLELFEVTTGLESSGLGCGQRVQPVPGGSPKAPQCWLVVVPRGDPAAENEGTPFAADFGVATSPLAPSAWEHRIAIPLEFNDLDTACDIAADQRRISGSEHSVVAIASWQPKLCAVPGLPPFAYGTVADATARQQLVSRQAGAPGMAVVSRPYDPGALDPTDPVVYAPLSVSGTVIGFNVERNPRPDAGAEEEALRGVRVAEINLTPRLVAKLLTQSYRSQTAIKASAPYDWVADNPVHMGLDPDFVQFNPEFALLQTAGGKNLGGLVLPARSSDAARQVWEWILADPEARAWLDGTPDRWGMRVNPVYATTAAANVTGIAFGNPVPELFPKSDPHCYQGPAQGPAGTVLPPLLCGTDWLPYASSLRDAARLTRAADDGARTSVDPYASSADKVYRPDGPQILGSRTMLALTDTASAFQYGLQAARLSRAGDDSDTRSFVAPDTAGLMAGVESMAPNLEPMVREPVPTGATAGAYPLTVLSYAAVAPLSLDATARDQYATFIEYASGPGQVPGRTLGQLPPGYAPLPALLQSQATTAARAIRELRAPAVPVPLDPALPSSSDDFGGAARSRRSAVIDGGADAPEVQPVGPPADSGPKEPEATVVTTPILALARNRYVLPVLGLVALLSALGTLEITKRPRRAVAAGSPPRIDEREAVRP